MCRPMVTCVLMPFKTRKEERENLYSLASNTASNLGVTLAIALNLIERRYIMTLASVKLMSFWYMLKDIKLYDID